MYKEIRRCKNLLIRNRYISHPTAGPAAIALKGNKQSDQPVCEATLDAINVGRLANRTAPVIRLHRKKRIIFLLNNFSHGYLRFNYCRRLVCHYAKKTGDIKVALMGGQHYTTAGLACRWRIVRDTVKKHISHMNERASLHSERQCNKRVTIFWQAETITPGRTGGQLILTTTSIYAQS
jgi:hypothetical protein